MRTLYDILGKRFGEWIVLERHGNDKNGRALWLARCSCGTEKIVVGSNLVHGHTTRCISCSNAPVAMMGRTFGQWTVVARAERDKSGNVRWVCRCSCGRLGRVVGGALRSGKSTRCRSCAGRNRKN
jgi:hypothetical protein